MTDAADTANTNHAGYTSVARTAILVAVRDQHEFGSLAETLADVAVELGTTEALTAGRPSSCEAELVQRVVKGSVGWDDDNLSYYYAPLS
jgi:hypothetical protein